MAGFVIHLAIGKKYAELNSINNISEFEKGIIAPDLLDKSTSHYGPYSSCPDLSKFLSENDLDSDYNKGYFLHLITDYLFYNKFLTEFSPEIYRDYDKLNKFLITRYGITIPSEIKGVVSFEEGEPQILQRDSLCNFIDTVAQINIKDFKTDEREEDFEFGR